jgi:phage shock protein A/DNA-binding Xre family transcriptional regulator
MGYRLRVPAEIGDWLAELRGSAPAAAAEVGASLVALMDAVVVPAPPLVVPVEPENPDPGDDDPRGAVDYVYQQLLSELQLVRQHVADIATARKRAELTLSEQQGQSDVSPEALAETTRLLHRAERLEEELTRQSQRLQLTVDGFRSRKEVAKAVYTAAVARRRIQTALEPSESGADDAEIAAADQSAAQATEQLEALVRQARRLKRAIRSFDAPGDREAASSARERPGSPDHVELLAVRADPLGSDIRVFCAIGPPGTATLLTVLEGPDAIAEDWDQAADAARMLLDVIRDGGWPPYSGQDGGGGLEFADTAPFLSEFFPDDSSAIAARAAELSSAGSLADLRAHRGMSLSDLETATGISERRLQAMEKGNLRHATLHELTAYLRAVGGRLEVTADLDGEHRRIG